MTRLKGLPLLALVGLSGACGDSAGPTSGPPDHLIFIIQPTQVHQGAAFGPKVIVEVRDSMGTPVTGSAVEVTLTFDTNPGSATLRGTTRRATFGGRATFSDIWVDQRGRGYRLSASAGTLPGIISDPFNVVAPLPVTQIAGGDEHTCALTTGGIAYCWGRHSGVGDVGAPPAVFPLPVVTDLRFDFITAGYTMACAVTSAGKAYCWGSNFNGRLGDSTFNGHTTPVAVQGSHVFSGQLSPAFDHACGLETSGTVYCWGGNNLGQLGDSTRNFSLAPVRVVGGLTFKSLHTKNVHACAVTTGGAAYCWGYNNQGELGDNTLTEKLAPQAVLGGHTFLSITAGFSHTCAIRTNGDAFCWGDNRNGEVGDGTTTDRLTPTAVLGGHKFVALEAQGQFTCGLTASGEAWCWGASYGSTPQAIGEPEPFVSLSAGFVSICAVSATHKAYCWGSNTYGELGDGTTTSRIVPALVVY